MRTKPLLRTLWTQIGEPLVAVALVFISTTAIAQPFYVPSGSMEPTLAIGDALLGSKFAYGYSRYSLPVTLGLKTDARLLGRLPKRGDVVVFRLPRDPKVVYVKRVIGLPGDAVQMVGGRLVINGQVAPLASAGTGQVEEADGQMRDADRFNETLPGGARHLIFKLRWDGALDNTPVFHIPKDNIFVMGDNRDDSSDSRVDPADGGVGFVPLENLMARADVTLGSYDFLNMHGHATWPGLVRVGRFFKSI
jgi:signal peptidase I